MTYSDHDRKMNTAQAIREKTSIALGDFVARAFTEGRSPEEVEEMLSKAAEKIRNVHRERFQPA